MKYFNIITNLTSAWRGEGQLVISVTGNTGKAVRKGTLKTFSNKELMTRYDVSAKTFKKWIDTMGEDFGPRIGNYYSPKQVKAIFAKYGKPCVIFFAVGIKIFSGDLMGGKDK